MIVFKTKESLYFALAYHNFRDSLFTDDFYIAEQIYAEKRGWA